MITRLSNWLIQKAGGISILILIALLLVFNRFLFPYFIIHSGPGEGKQMLDTLFGFNPDQAYYLLHQYGEAGRKGYIVTLAVADTIYPFVYAGLLALTLSWLLKTKGFQQTPLQKMNLIPLAAMVFDLLENAGIIAMLIHFPAQNNALAGYASLMGMAKWILIILSILMIIGWAVWGLISVMKGK